MLAWGHTQGLSNQHLCDLKHLAHLLRGLNKMFCPSAVGGSSESKASIFPLCFLSKPLVSAAQAQGTAPACRCSLDKLERVSSAFWGAAGESPVLTFAFQSPGGITECSTRDSEQHLSFRVLPSPSDAWREAFMAAAFQRAGSRDGISLQGDLQREHVTHLASWDPLFLFLSSNSLESCATCSCGSQRKHYHFPEFPLHHLVLFNLPTGDLCYVPKPASFLRELGALFRMYSCHHLTSHSHMCIIMDNSQKNTSPGCFEYWTNSKMWKFLSSSLSSSAIPPGPGHYIEKQKVWSDAYLS